MRKITGGDACEAKGLIKLLTIIFLLIVTGATVWAENQVVTIYFCGTGIKSDAYNPDNTSWKVDPELLSTMYRADGSVEIEQGPWVWYYGAWTPPKHTDTYTDPHHHHKYIANGVGTSPGTNLVDIVLAILGSADPDLGPRSWHNVIVEAKEALLEVYAHHPNEDYTVNLLGYSRGGISAMMMARALTEPAWGFVKKINVLVYDPVPGGFDPVGKFGNNLHISSKVNQYVAIYAEHEHTYQFEPVIPFIESNATKRLMVKVPGSHETLAGNHQMDGHFMTLFQVNPVGSDTRNPSFRYVKDMSRVVAEQLLTSNEWGNVPFALDESIGTKGVDSREEFDTLLSNMWAQNYYYTSLLAFAPVWGTYDGPFALVGRDYMLRILVPWPTNYHSRLCFIAPYRHSPEWLWPFPWYFPNAEQVYYLDQKVPRVSAATWDTLQSLRGGPPPGTDTTPPVPTVDPLPPVTGECSVIITFPPTATDDVSGTVVGTTSDPLTYTQQGTYTITWTYTDASGNSSTQTQTVVVDDTTPPVIENLTASPNLLWPANHKMVPVTVRASASDNCSGNSICRITSVSSNEPENGLGDGDTSPDWKITGNLTLNLRAERSGKGSGRIYTITVKCADADGNSSSGNVRVSVPHDQGKKPMPNAKTFRKHFQVRSK